MTDAPAPDDGPGRAAERLARAAALAAIAVGLWFRVSSIGALPEVNSDEAWYGLQAGRIVHGQPFAATTFSGNPLNPFFAGFHVLLLAVCEPSPWVLRLPAALCGVAAVALAYRVASRVADRRAGRLAAVLLAALPAAVLFSRAGDDTSQIPLVGLLALDFAFRARAVGLVLTLLAGLVIHPTNAFLLPIALPVFAARLLERYRGRPAELRRVLVVTALAAVGVAAVVGAWVLRRPYTRAYYLAHFARPDWPAFVLSFGRFLLARMRLEPGPEPGLDAADYAFWALVVPVAILGSYRQARERQWDRLALSAGVILAAVALHLAGGSRVLVDVFRYGVVLVAPTALAFALLARPLLGGRGGVAVRALRAAVVPALALILLVSFKLHWLDGRARGPAGVESIWSLRCDERNYHRQALDVIRRDLRRARPPAGAGPTLVIAQDWWNYGILGYLAGGRADLRVASYVPQQVDPFSAQGHDPDDYRAHLADHLAAGAYAVAYNGGPLDKVMQSSYAPDQLRRWAVRLPNGAEIIHIYRIRRPGEPADTPAALAAGAGKVSR